MTKWRLLVRHIQLLQRGDPQGIKVLPGFIFGGRNFNNKGYADLLVADTGRKLQEVLDKIVKENEKRGLIINSQTKECMDVSKGNSPRSELRTGDTKTKQVRTFNYPGKMFSQKENVTSCTKDA